MDTSSGKTYVIGSSALYYARHCEPRKKVVLVVPNAVLKAQIIESLGRLSYIMDIYTVAEFYLLLPDCDALFIDEWDYMINTEIYAPLSNSLYNGVWDLSKYKLIFGFTATVGNYLQDVIKNVITEKLCYHKLGSEF
jgi:hypothetical protein